LIPDANVPQGSKSSHLRARPPFRLHDVEVRPASNEFVIGGAHIRVPPRLMDVLLRLAATPGQVVSREALLEDAWPRRMVNDDVLSRVIADLRGALRDDAREARFIETLPKVGYRLIAPVSPVAAAGSTATMKPRSRAGWWSIAGAFAAAAALTLALVLTPRPAPGITDRARLERQLAQAEPFSSDVALEVGPRFSPDGQTVAFALGEGRRAQIAVRGVRSSQRMTIGDPADLNLSPVFFPDGKRIAFLRRSASGECGIVAQELATGAQQQLADCARKPRPRFDLSPDGTHLVYVGEIRPQFPGGLILRDLASGRETTLTAPDPDLGDDLYPRFSPDGTRIVFFRGSESHRQAWLLEVANAAGARNLNSPRGLSYGAAWLGPQGPLLVAADWFGQRALNLLDPQTGNAAMVGARGARFPDADGLGNLVYENALYSANLFEVDPAVPDEKPRELWPSTRYTNQPEYSPDGTRVLFISNRDGAAAIYVARPDGDAQRLPLPADFIYMRPHWALDGRALYAIRASRREDGARIQQAIRVALPEGQVEVLGALGDNVFDVREIDGGRQWLVGEAAANAARVLRVAAGGGQPERLPLPIVSEYQVAGRRIAFAQPLLTGLTTCDLATLKCEPLAVPIEEANRFDWLLTADALWYRTGATPDEVVRYDLDRRAVTWRSSFAPTALGLSLAVRPDGRALLLAREGPLSIDLVYAPRGAR